MKTTLTIMAILAIAAALGAVGVLTSISFVQQADAYTCNFNYKVGNFKCSPSRGVGDGSDNYHYHYD